MHQRQPEHHNLLSRIKGSQEGVIVWDHKGVVIMWPEGHSSRFAWSMLRSLCTCAECQGNTVQEKSGERHAA